MVQNGLALALIPLWVRFLLPDDYAISQTLAAYGTMLATLGLLGLHAAAGKHIIDLRDQPAERAGYLLTVTLFLALVPGVALALLNLFGAGLWAAVSGATIPFHPFVRLMLATVYFTAVLTLFQAVLQHQHRAGAYVGVQLGQVAVNLAAMLLLVVAWRLRALGMMSAQALAAAAAAGAALALNWRTLRGGRVAWRHLRRALGYGLPLVPYSLAVAVMMAADRAVLERHRPALSAAGAAGADELGLYNFAALLGLVGSFLVASVNLAWAPHYLGMMKEDADANPRVVRAVSLYLAAMGGTLLLGMSVADAALRLLVPVEFHGAARFLPVLLLGYLFMGLYQFASLPLASFEKTRWFPVVAVPAAAATLGLYALLVPRFGALGAAWGFAAGQALLLALAYPVGQRYQRARYPLGRYAGAVAIVAAAAAFLASPAPAWWPRPLLLLAFALYAYAMLVRPSLRPPPPPTPPGR